MDKKKAGNKDIQTSSLTLLALKVGYMTQLCGYKRPVAELKILFLFSREPIQNDFKQFSLDRS